MMGALPCQPLLVASNKEYMIVNLYTKVKINNDVCKRNEIPIGSNGFVIDDFGDETFDIEVCKKNGETIAIVALKATEFTIDDSL
jgi:hypothetical protein